MKVRHVGEGRTNPNNRIPSLILLRDYLENGFVPGPMTSQDRHLEEGERKCEEAFRGRYGYGA